MVEDVSDKILLLPNLHELSFGDESAGPQQFCYAGGLRDPPTNMLPEVNDEDKEEGGAEEESDPELDV
ncbi:hypothetical protein EW026_g6906 [Hermanssonia centrifuga]|uniref:Uncharacterized protein n=1 Tax=Hermanssonia centrifuga TaxID=98765 RepID=A0A4S4K9J3_9APHY|nr:hypothetical protein EW026_g6906 [Hermanssonia centrifuga]